MDIYYNGIIYLNDEKTTKASAMAVEGGLIKAVGSDEDILAMASDGDTMLDLQGRLVMPGFVDSHLHFVEYAVEKSFVDLSSAGSLEELLGMMRERLPEALEKNKPLRGFSFDNNYWEDPSLPTREDLDGLSAEIPITVRRTCHHVTVCNTPALEICGMLEDCPDGILNEEEQNAVIEKLLTFTKEEFKELILDACSDAVKAGITEVQTDDLEYMRKELYGKTILDAYMELDKEGRLPIRVYEQCNLPSADRLNAFLDAGFRTGYSTGHFTIGPLKLVADGALGSRTAALRKPYPDDPSNYGILNFTDQEMEELVDTAHRAGLQIAIHGIGDRTIDQILNSYEKALRAHPGADHRHGIVHCQITHPEQLQKMKELDLMAYIQPIFIRSDQWIAEDRVGKDLAATSYDWRSMTDMGIHLGFGSDCPVESFDIMPNMYYAVAMKDPDKKTPWHPEHAVTMEEAIRSFTAEGAYASFAEDRRGRLVPGFTADFCVIDRDITSLPPEALNEAKVIMTFVDGKRVF
ncbi:MAG: amidohydrolase [Firmicutes bacterium]|nr:amidohydrolase [Bacillota bacterium]MBR6955543.1 amidohydrolase [Bacillota bacterium]